ncbi:MAG: bifunctional riboflavin kinase/FAD synthetase [Legionella sp.]|nr:bifunctional riboflavin kinase/FAD synthetase [Legionella sp.]
MQLLRKLDSSNHFSKGSVVTVGNFDGVHRGHQALLTQLKHEAERRSLPSVLLLFEPQPSEFFYGLQAPARLTCLREKLALLKKHVDYVGCLRFNASLAALPAEIFVEKYLLTLLRAEYLLVGNDFRFGSARQGDRRLLEKLMQEDGNRQVEFFPDFFIKNERISSTKIREALQAGDLQSASALLGRTFSLSGHVVRGAGRGGQWGIPTANVHIRRAVLPLRGVFAVKVLAEGQWLKGVANIGTRPTVQGVENTLEVHLLDFTGNLYGKLIQVFFSDKLRDEIKFPSIKELLDQIHADIVLAGKRLKQKECCECIE